MIHVTFPDGAKRAYEPGISGLEIAKSISPSLAKRSVAMVLSGELADLADPIDRDATLEFIGRDDPRALGTHPPRRRPRSRRGGAVALAGTPRSPSAR